MSSIPQGFRESETDLPETLANAYNPGICLLALPVIEFMAENYFIRSEMIFSRLDKDRPIGLCCEPFRILAYSI